MERLNGHINVSEIKTYHLENDISVMIILVMMIIKQITALT